MLVWPSKNLTWLLLVPWLLLILWLHSTKLHMISMSEPTKLTMLLITSPFTSHWKETISILPLPNSKPNKICKKSRKPSLTSTEPKLKKKNLAQARMYKLSNNPCEINSTTMAEKYRQYIPKSRKEVLQLSHHQLRIFVVRLLNGRFGIPILKTLKSRPNRMIKVIMLINKFQRRLQNLADIHHHFWDVWKLWREWSDRMKKIASIVITSIIGKKVKNKINLKVIFYLFGDCIMRRKRSTLLL